MTDSSDYRKRKDAAKHLEVLRQLRRWDPIGIFHNIDRDDENSPAFDEYDAYAPTIVRMLDAGIAPDALAQHLADLAEHTMATHCEPAATIAVANALANFWTSHR